MDADLNLILTLTGCLAAALALGYLTQRLGLSPLVGYLLAGVAVGPNTPGFVADRHLAEQLAEVGVILLMFGVGLHFQLKHLWAVRAVAVPGAVGQSLAATALGAAVFVAFGWGWAAGVVYGLAVSVASTVVLTRVLSDHNDLHTPSGHVAVGWLVVEDLFTVVVLVLMPSLFGREGGGSAGLFVALGLAVVKVAVLAGVTFVAGGRVIPWLLGLAARTRSRELFTLTVLVVALAVAVGSAKFFGVSMALGAFLAGMVVGRSEFGLRAAAEALPMRDAFAVLFFVSVGMLFDPRGLLEAPGLAAATLGIVLVGKPLAALAIVLLLRRPVRVALAVAVALAQVGEFTFILAALGRSLGVLPPAATNALVVSAVVSISVNPLLYRLVDPAASWLARRTRWRWLTEGAALAPASADPARRSATASPRHRAVVVGYGPVGRTLCRLLREDEVEPTVVELNVETVRRLRDEGVEAIYGDAAHAETLRAAGVAEAATLILSSSGLNAAREIIRLARELNPKVRILVRCSYLREAAELRRDGADAAFSGEGEVALAMAESVLRDLGAVSEQIERDRDRVRAELFGAGAPEDGSEIRPGAGAAREGDSAAPRE